jgi:hypothetical protein
LNNQLEELSEELGNERLYSKNLIEKQVKEIEQCNIELADLLSSEKKLITRVKELDGELEMTIKNIE